MSRDEFEHDDWLDGPCQEDVRKPPLIDSLLRGLAALLVTPFLLLAVITIGAWLHAQGKVSDW
jgi:hypothetical protein